MLTIAYYTEGTSYEAEAKLLKGSLNMAGMEHNVVGVPDGGDWYANTASKARFIYEQRMERRGPLLYIDVDAYVHQNVEAYFERLDRQGYDFGAHWFRGPAKGHDRSKMRTEGWWMLSGTLFFGDTQGARDLLATWCRMNHLFRQSGIMEGGGQKNLWYLVACMTGLKAKRLPGRYCYVFDKPWAYPHDEPRLIEHTIASRDNRSGRKRKNPSRGARMDELRERIGTYAT